MLADLVSTPEVYKKIVGMQMLIEGLAMGSFATLNAKTNDPVLRRLVQLVMSDEAFHHRFGRLWANKTIGHLSPEEHRKVEDWSAQLFQMLLFNLINAEQKQVIYAKYGLDWQWVRDSMKEAFTDDHRREQLKDSTNIFRVLIKTLLHAGIITQRTAPLYAVWVDMKELEAEGDAIPGDVVAEETMVLLREIKERGYVGGITQLKTFIQTHKIVTSEPLVRFETAPGMQLQADFTTVRRGREPLRRRPDAGVRPESSRSTAGHRCSGSGTRRPSSGTRGAACSGTPGSCRRCRRRASGPCPTPRSPCRAWPGCGR